MVKNSALFLLAFHGKPVPGELVLALSGTRHVIQTLLFCITAWCCENIYAIVAFFFSHHCKCTYVHSTLQYDPPYTHKHTHTHTTNALLRCSLKLCFSSHINWNSRVPSSAFAPLCQISLSLYTKNNSDWNSTSTPPAKLGPLRW